MARCWHCGDEIEFRYIDGKPTPIHLSGGWCQGGGDGVSHSLTNSVRAATPRFEDVCHPTKCPKCGAAVFFIRHNGGSVWVDDLGWPWNKHSCFDSAPTPPWFGYIKKQSYSMSTSGSIVFGVIVRAQWVSEDERGPSRIILAVDGGAHARMCLATTGTNTADYLLGRVAIVDAQGEHMVTSNHEVRPILPVVVKPEELGLPTNWLTANAIASASARKA